MAQQIVQDPVDTPAAPVPEAVPPADNAEVVRLRDHAQRLLDEKKREKERADAAAAELQKLKEAQKQAETETLTEQQQYKTLWEQAQNTNQELKSQLDDARKELENVRTSAEQETLRARFNSAVAKEIIAPDQFYELNRANIKSKDGQPVFLLGGVETDLKTALDRLKQPGSGYEHHFRPSGMGGMGAGGVGAAGMSTQAADNPYTSGNITQRMQLELDNPDLAARLKAQARSVAR